MNMSTSEITTGKLLFLLCLTTFVLLANLVFETSQILHDQQSLRLILLQQEKPLEDISRTTSQFRSLALGTKNLAEEGHTEAAVIVERLRQAGVVFDDANPAQPLMTVPSPPAQP